MLYPTNIRHSLDDRSARKLDSRGAVKIILSSIFSQQLSKENRKSTRWTDTLQTESERKGREKIACRAVAIVRVIDDLIRCLVGRVKTRKSCYVIEVLKYDLETFH